MTIAQNNWLELMAKQTQVTQILDTNQFTEKFGLVLGKEDAELLAQDRADTLRNEQRIEFGQGILPKIIYAFCDSSYIMQDNYRDSLSRLQEIFFLYKNEMLDEITDDELLELMGNSLKMYVLGILIIWREPVWIFLPRQFVQDILTIQRQEDEGNLKNLTL